MWTNLCWPREKCLPTLHELNRKLYQVLKKKKCKRNVKVFFISVLSWNFDENRKNLYISTYVHLPKIVFSIFARHASTGQ